MNFRYLLGCDTTVTCIFGGKFWGQALRPSNIEVHPVHQFDTFPFKFD